METHIFFFLLAGVLIALLVGYSLWSSRREKSRIDTFSQRSATQPVGGNQPESSLSHDVIEPLSVDASSLNVEPAPSAAPTPEREIKVRLPDEDNEPMHVTSSPPSIETRFVTLYVVAAQGQQFQGTQMVPQLEALGLQFGANRMFHRHVDGPASPVLFSVANMMQPGTFDLSQNHQFSTVGVAFFMQLPSPTNDLLNLRTMINTAENLAQHLGGFMLDDQQQLFNEASRQSYLQQARHA